ncbi:hypothetical protein [Maribellus sediminis]|uniref:hypothetical protein n=1 Tax=Maribellus sediminis TaxID=2696285 RepID=UPI00197E8781|nr:hypothetical protein [Maribellus sediminis]
MMTATNKLLTIKIAHTIIWVFFVSVIVYILYTGIIDAVNTYTWVGIGLVVAEGLVLLAFRSFCPLTVLARRYSDSDLDNFDIFLPNWLAKHNKLIFTILFAVGVVLVLWRTFINF